MIKETIVRLDEKGLEYRNTIRKLGFFIPEQRTVKISDVPIPVWLVGEIYDDELNSIDGENFKIDPKTEQITEPQYYFIRPALKFPKSGWKKEFELTPESIFEADLDDGQALIPFWFSGYLSREDAEIARRNEKKTYPEDYVILQAQIPAESYFFALESWRKKEKVSEVVFRKIEPLGYNNTNKDEKQD